MMRHERPYEAMVHKDESGSDVYLTTILYGCNAIEAFEYGVDIGLIHKAFHGMYIQLKELRSPSLIFTFPIYFEE